MTLQQFLSFLFCFKLPLFYWPTSSLSTLSSSQPGPVAQLVTSLTGELEVPGLLIVDSA